MEYRKLGKWGVKISKVGLGSYLTIGMHVSDELAAECVAMAFDAGINWFDTANAYNRGQAEVSFGKLLKGRPRESYVLATKVWAPMGDGPNDQGLSAKHVFEQCHASLKRLQMDYIDLYQCHRPDPDTPLEETVRIMDDLARQGKILYWGCSEWPPALMQQACDLAQMMGCRPPVSNQPRYSMLWRYPEEQVFPTTLSLGMGNVLFSPLAHGVLSGKYKPGQPPPAGTRAADDTQNKIMMDLYFTDDILERAGRLNDIAAELDMTAAQLSLAWCLKHPAVTSVIIGATKIQQMRDNVAVGDRDVPDEVYEVLCDLFPRPELSAP